MTTADRVEIVKALIDARDSINSDIRDEEKFNHVAVKIDGVINLAKDLEISE